MRQLIINSGHLSAETRAILSRMESVGGFSFTRKGDSATPFFGEMTFPLRSFTHRLDDGPKTDVRALPRDLWFLHVVGSKNGFDQLVVSPRAERHQALPWYGTGNEIIDPGEILAREKVRRSRKVPRQSQSGAKIESVSPGKITEGQVQLEIRDAEQVPSP